MEPTDSKSIASLLDSECDIPFDVHFGIEDIDGNKLETLGGHKALLALKSPVFKAMLFGPMKESGKVVKIKGTTVFAFKTLLLYIHEAEEEWWPWTIDVHELVRVVDLAERFNLAGPEVSEYCFLDRIRIRIIFGIRILTNTNSNDIHFFRMSEYEYQ